MSEAQALQSGAERQALTANIVFGVGAAAALTGAWLLFDGSEAVAVAPSSGGGMLAWRGQCP